MANPTLHAARATGQDQVRVGAALVAARFNPAGAHQGRPYTDSRARATEPLLAHRAFARFLVR